MNEVKHSIVSSISQYLNNLQYLAQDDKKTASDLILLIMVDDLYEWSSWYNSPQNEQLKLQNLRKEIIRNNTNLVEPISRTNEFYKNVNLPQSIYTWQRVYDSIDVNEINTI